MKFKEFLLLFLTIKIVKVDFGQGKHEFHYRGEYHPHENGGFTAQGHVRSTYPYPPYPPHLPHPSLYSPYYPPYNHSSPFEVEHKITVNEGSEEKPKPEEKKPEEEKKWNLETQKVKFTIISENFVTDVLSKNEEFNKKIANTGQTGAPNVIFNKKGGLNEWFNKKIKNWENQPDVKEAFDKINKEIEDVYSTSKWENKIKKGKVKESSYWPKTMFLLHMLFKLFDKIMEKLINDVEKKLISDETCSQIFKEKNQEETLKLLKKHKEMLNKNNNKINDYFNSIKDNSDEKFKKWNDFKEKNLFDVEIILPIKIPKIKFIIIKNDFINNIVNKIKFFNEKIKREEKTTNAVDVITQLYVVSLNNNSNKVTFAYWLKEILNDWKVQTSAIEVFKKIKEDILKDYGIKENLNNLLRKSNWCYLMFMLHTVFELYKKVLKIIVEKVEIKKNICNYIDKKDEECDEFIKKLNEMVIENDKKINEFFELNKDIFNDKEILIKWKGFIEKNLFDVEIEIKLEENKVEVKEPEEKKEFIRKITEKIRVRGNVHFNPYSFNYSPPQFPTHSPFHLPINHNGIQYNKFEGKYSGQFNDKGYDFSHNARYYHH